MDISIERKAVEYIRAKGGVIHIFEAQRMALC